MDTYSQQKKTVDFTFGAVVQRGGSQEQSLKSITDQNSSRRVSKVIESNVLPVNFFHSPGEYNRMLIRSSAVPGSSAGERQLGVIRNLQFINEPIFASEIEMRSKRTRDYNHNMKLQSSSKTNNDDLSVECCCCCCDSYCTICANETLCQWTERGKNSSNMLIDIEAMKRGEVTKTRKSAKPQERPSTGHLHVQERQREGSYKMNELITTTLVKQIERKRTKQLMELQKQDRKQELRRYNQMVRNVNASAPAPVPASRQLHKSLTSYQLREAYWKSKKKLIVQQLKKERSREKKSEKKVEEVCHERKLKLSAEAIHKLRLLHEEQAMSRQAMGRMKKEQLQKIKQKKMLALAAKQAQIINKCPSKSFKPSQSAIDSAFIE